MGYIIVGTIIGGIIWGIVVNKVIENKGYEENWFWWGFFFGIFALIVALTKQSVNTTKVVIESSIPVKENMELLSNCILDNKVNVSSPVHIVSWEIKKDAEKLVLFVDFINVSHKEISAVMFSATGFNSFGDIVRVNDADFFDVIGQDLSIKSNGYGKVYTTLQDDAIRKVEIKVKKICFADGTIVDDIQDEWINTNQLELKPVHIDCARRENTQSKYYAIIKEHYWQCVCGFVNTQNACAICGMQKNNALKFTQNNIEDIHNEYIKQIEIEKNEKAKRQSEEKRLQEEKQARAKKNKKILAYSTGIVAVCVIVAMVLNAFVIPSYKYNKAIKLMDEQKNMEGIKLLSETGGYKDASKIIQNYYKQYQGKISVISHSNYYYDKVYDSDVLGLKSNGTVIFTNNNDNRQDEVSNWKDIIQIDTSNSHIVGLKSDGTVVAIGNNDNGQCDVSNWGNIVQISTSSLHTIGLKSDGTVVTTDNSDNKWSDISNWKDIIQITTSSSHIVGLKVDGTVVVTDNDNKQSDISNWKNIVQITASSSHIVGLKADGTVVAVGNNDNGQCDVSNWKGIVQIAASNLHTVGLKADGSIVAVGNTISVPRKKDEWINIVAISAGGAHTVGLKSDGTLVTTYPNVIDISNWDLID